MTQPNHAGRARLRAFSRRKFIKLAAAAGLLAGCRPVELLVTPSSPSPPTRTSPPVPTPTSMPAKPPTATPAATPTLRPVPPKPAAIKMYPDVPSAVVHASHAGAWSKEAKNTLVPGALAQMLDASITRLTGLNDAREAWKALFRPNERIAIKINTIASSLFWTHVPLVMAVTERLTDAGIPPEHIVIYDRMAREMTSAGFQMNADGPGVGCRATEAQYTPGWTLAEHDIKLSDILLSCDALINMPILKAHTMSGMTFAIKNHFGTIDTPDTFHGSIMSQALSELAALAPIRQRTRLIVGDALTVCTYGKASGWWEAVTSDSIFMSFDPVASDTAALQHLVKMATAEERGTAAMIQNSTAWLGGAAKQRAGTSDEKNMQVIKVALK